MENINATGIDTAILSKIAGLLKLAERNANVNESASAASAAQALLSKHRLTVADLDAATNTKESPGVADAPLITGNRISQWKSDLASAVCSANGCKLYIHKVYAKTGMGEIRTRMEYDVNVKLIGRPTDIAVVRYFYAYLEREIERLSAVAVAGGGITGKSGTNSFKIGAVVAISQRLREAVKAIRAEVTEGTEGCTAMVRLDTADREVDDFFSSFTKGFTKGQRSQSKIQGEAYYQGKEAGAGIALNKATNLLN